MSKLLQELLALHEAPSIPKELKTIFDAKASADFTRKAIDTLWSSGRLMWHGDRFFGEGETAYQKAEEAAKEVINDGTEVSINIPFDTSNVGTDSSDEEDDDEPENNLPSHMGGGEVDFDAEIQDQQECYLGYNPKTDKLFIGFDAWVSDEELHDGFDNAFRDATGEEYDGNNETHEAVWNEVWQTWQKEKIGFVGLVYEISDHGGTYSAEEAIAPMHGGFYKGTYKVLKGQYPGMVDLRLD